MEIDFATKKKMLFESLESAEKSLEGTSLQQTNRDLNLTQNRQQRKRNRDDYVDKYKHKDSLFKRPDLPINKCLRYRQKPDYEVSYEKNLTSN
jgi:Tumour suppressing sub-chromosomal transferable candidate 4